MDWSERVIYGVVGAAGTSLIGLFSMWYWWDDGPNWPIIGLIAALGGLVGALTGERVLEILRDLWRWS